MSSDDDSRMHGEVLEGKKKLRYEGRGGGGG